MNKDGQEMLKFREDECTLLLRQQLLYVNNVRTAICARRPVRRAARHFSVVCASVHAKRKYLSE